jgi:peroxiredoxin
MGVAVGGLAPAATLRGIDGHQVALADLVKRGSVLVVFYRGGWCPYCNFEIHELAAAFPEYQRRGVTPVAISVDRIEEAAKTQKTYEIPFPVLSDPDLAAHRAFRVVHEAGAAEVGALKTFGIDIESASGRDHHAFAIPAIFLVDPTGTVRWAHADPDYKVRPHTPQVLAAIDTLGLRVP